ncbi:nuclear factor nf2 [Cystoisospora suis]|uniref:Nuclear factor nf2 n=1 Tax=Cystoisospora suis TaxID=483139 RepID=A0A2C6LBY2_9APIC|nr:nuclear factor nf2 [Cystoisospora suis]
MNEKLLHQEIRRLVTEQRQLNRRLQHHQKPFSSPYPSSSSLHDGTQRKLPTSSPDQPSSSSSLHTSGISPSSFSSSGVSPPGIREAIKTNGDANSLNRTPSQQSSSSSSLGCDVRALKKSPAHHVEEKEEGEEEEEQQGRGKTTGDMKEDCSLRMRGRGMISSSHLVDGYQRAIGDVVAAAAGLKRPFGSMMGSEKPVYDFNSEEFQVEKRPKIEAPDEKTARRNRRMFGVLAGHLRRAQQQLQKEQTTDLVAKQRQQEERVAQKIARSQKNIAKIARIEWEERRQQEKLRLEEVSMALINKENDLMKLHLVKHYKNMELYIGTEAQPTLFWMPAKWDDTTRRLQEQTKMWIRTKIEHIQETDYTYRGTQGGQGGAGGGTVAGSQLQGTAASSDAPPVDDAPSDHHGSVEGGSSKEAERGRLSSLERKDSRDDEEKGGGRAGEERDEEKKDEREEREKDGVDRGKEENEEDEDVDLDDMDESSRTQKEDKPLPRKDRDGGSVKTSAN